VVNLPQPIKYAIVFIVGTVCGAFGLSIYSSGGIAANIEGISASLKNIESGIGNLDQSVRGIKESNNAIKESISGLDATSGDIGSSIDRLRKADIIIDRANQRLADFIEKGTR
jgi:archaellum component FlaC